MPEILILLLLAAAPAALILFFWTRYGTPPRSRRYQVLQTAGVLFLSLLLTGVAAFYLSRSRTFQLFGEIVPRVETTEPVVALTFDDGPYPQGARQVADILRNHSVRATFFLNGRPAEQHPELVSLLIRDGHELGNHTYSHRRLLGVSLSTVREEIERTDQALRSAGYKGPIHFRSPYGKKLFLLPWYLWRHDRKNIFWDQEPDSDPRLSRSAERIAESVITNTRPGSIILLHPMTEPRRPSRDALPAIIEGLRRRGFRFVTVSELLEKGER